MSYITQVFDNGELVSKANMNNTFNNPLQILTAFFPINPCIVNGISNIKNNFGQIGTSNVFVFIAGSFRFLNQQGPIGSTSNVTFADFGGGQVTVFVTSDSPSQLYIVASLSQVIIDAYQYSNTANILPTALTLAQINLLPTGYVVLCIITNANGVYSVSLDANCSFNYGITKFPDIADNSVTGDVTTGGRLIGSTITNKTIDALGNVASCVASSDVLGKAYLQMLIRASDSSILSGIAIPYNARPYLAGNLSTLATADNSIATLIDLHNIVTTTAISDASSTVTNNSVYSLIVNKANAAHIATLSASMSAGQMTIEQSINNPVTGGTTGVITVEGKRPALRGNLLTLEQSLASLAVFGDFYGNRGLNGYLKLPNAWILQWGSYYQTAGGIVTFNLPFPSDCFFVMATSFNGITPQYYSTGNITQSNCRIFASAYPSTLFIFCIGY